MGAPGFRRSARSRLNAYDIERFAGSTLLDRIARTVCGVGCLPRKELFEAWEVAKRVRRRFRGRPIVELCAGHGLLAYMLLLLDDSAPGAICVDVARPKSFGKLAAALEETWPRLRERVRYVTSNIDDITVAPGSVVVSVHACGDLSDRVIDRAVSADAALAIVPCCHALAKCDTGGLLGWIDGAMAIDVTRARRLSALGYHVRTQTIPADITPQNRLLLATPPARV